jgi:hypothetical protein
MKIKIWVVAKYALLLVSVLGFFATFALGIVLIFAVREHQPGIFHGILVFLVSLLASYRAYRGARRIGDREKLKTPAAAARD